MLFNASWPKFMTFNKDWLPTDRKEMAQMSYDNAIREHAELWDAWKVLEAKAQTTLAISGVLEAAAFAYVTTSTKPAIWSWQGSVFIILITLLCCSIVLSVRCIRVASVGSPHRGEEGHEEVMFLIDGNDSMTAFSTLHENLIRDTAKRWSRNNDALGKALGKKAKYLLLSQNALIAAAIFAALFIVMFVYSLN